MDSAANGPRFAAGDAWLRRLGWAAWALVLALLAGAIVFLARSYATPVELSWGFRGSMLPVTLAFSTVGVLITSRLPRHRIGWLFHWVGLGFGTAMLTEEYAILALLAQAGRLPGGEVAAWIDNWVWILTIPGIFLLALWFPDGRLLSRRWQAAVAALLVGMAGICLRYAFGAGIMESSFPIPNPFGVESPVIAASATVGFPFLAGAIAASAVSLFVRLRRARGVEREKLKWLVYAVALVPVVLVIDFTVGPATPVAEALTLTAIAAMPVAVGIAILRHRLYDIDLIIRRTLIYALLSAALALVYFGSVILLQTFFRSLTGEVSQLAVVASTLAIAALFSPLRRRVQDFIDRRFYRRKYDAAQTLAAFAATARDETDLDRLAGRLVGVVTETVQPAHVDLWLRRPEKRK